MPTNGMTALQRPKLSANGAKAIYYARQHGIPVLPLHTVLPAGRCSCGRHPCPDKPGKHPRIIGGVKSATTDETQILEWWQRWPDANIGGRMLNHVAVDIDPQHNGDQGIEWLQDAYDRLPYTPTQRSGGGGEHRIFKHPGGHVTSTTNVFGHLGFPGIDIRSNDTYIVLEPSNHISGGTYEFEASATLDDIEPAELPEWFVGALNIEKNRTFLKAGERSGLKLGPNPKKFIAQGAEIGEQRDHALITARALQGAGYPIERARDLVWQGLNASPIGDPRRPWTRKQSDEIVDDIYSSSPSTPRILSQQATTQQVEGNLAIAPRHVLTIAEPATHGYKRTDAGNAERLIAGCCGQVRFCHAYKRFLAWDETHFRIDETGGSPIMHRAIQVVREMYGEATGIEDTEDRKAFNKFVASCESKAKLEAMIGLFRLDPSIAIAPSDLDRDPWLLNCLNGTLDLRTGQLKEHDQRDLITRCIPVAYDPDAKCPTWGKFLLDVMDGDEDLVKFLLRAIGYSLTGQVTEHKLFFMHGMGANGKGTLVRIVQALLGEYSKTIDSEILMLSRGTNANGPTPEIAKLKGTRFVAASETSDGKRIDEARVKTLTGGDRITACHKYGDPFEFDPAFKLWISGNHRPEIRGQDNGIWRRICLVPFSVTFSDNPKAGEKQKDSNLEAKLATELPGILAWAVKGCLEWHRDGLNPPQAVQRAVDDYRSDMDVLGQFLEDAIERVEGQSVSPRELHKAYDKWRVETGNPAISEQKLGREMKSRGEAHSESSGRKFYRGMQLREAYATDYTGVYRGGE